MIRNLKQRIFITLVATVLACAFGAMVGYMIGRAAVFHLAESRLVLSSAHTLSAVSSYSGEARDILEKINGAPLPFCTEADLRVIRTLLFHSHYLKEAGRLHGTAVACSATYGLVDLPTIQAKPDFTMLDGTRLYKRLNGFQMDFDGLSFRTGDSYVVMNPYAELPPGAFAHIKITMLDALSRSTTSFIDGSKVPEPYLSQTGSYRVGGILYATICSALNHTCLTTFQSEAEALQADTTQLTVYVLAGALAGALIGLFCSLFYQRSTSIEQHLRRAIRKDQLYVVYQPIVELADGRIVGAEALVRLTSVEGFAIGPDIFVKIAEELGFVGQITELVVRHVLRDFQETLRTHPGFHLSVNAASADMSDPEFLPMLSRSLELAKVSAKSLIIEITEGSTVRHAEAMEGIRQLRLKGHSVHIDDFGTGYSSLSYLHALSVDAIKIDRAFTQAIGTDAVTVSILPQILAMAEKLNLEVVVEGVETPVQAEFFASSSRPIRAQGWLFGRPVLAEEFHRIFAEDERKRPRFAGLAN